MNGEFHHFKAEDVVEIFEDIDKNREKILEELKSYIELQTVSKGAEEQYIEQTNILLQTINLKLQELGFYIEPPFGSDFSNLLSVQQSSIELENKAQAKYATSAMAEDTQPAAPDVIFASLYSNYNYATVLIYGYIDVNPAQQADGWRFEPFRLYSMRHVLYGRGVAGGKGQLICWLTAIEAWLKRQKQLPLNIKLIIEAQHEQQSLGLREQLTTRVKEDFFDDVKYVLLLNNSWLSEQHALVHCNVNGWQRFEIEVQSHNEDETKNHTALNELCYLMNTLFDVRQRVRVPHFERHCRVITTNEWLWLNAAEYGLEECRHQLNVDHLPYKSKAEMLQQFWCKPSLTLHGVSSSASSVAEIYSPHSACATFSVKLVPEQCTDYVAGILEDYLRQQFRVFETKNTLSIRLGECCSPLHCDTRAPHILALCKALRSAHNIEPCVPKTICTHLPVLQLLRSYCPTASVLLVPYANFNALLRNVNESIPIEWFMRNAKLCAALFFELSNMTNHYPNQQLNKHNPACQCLLKIKNLSSCKCSKLKKKVIKTL